MTRPFDSIMMRTMLGPLVGATQLFALYVLIHGHYSPGGGFQGGVLLAAAVILPMLVYGRESGPPDGLLFIGPRGSICMAAVGVLIYFGIGLVSVAKGNPFLNYEDLPLPLDAAMRRSMGSSISCLPECGLTRRPSRAHRVSGSGGRLAVR